MTPSPRIAALLASLALLLAVPPVAAGSAGEAPECRRFSGDGAGPKALAPRLGRLCVRLVDAHASPGGLSEEEIEAATQLGTYLAVVGELELRRGAAGLGGGAASAPGTTDVARYLIADRLGLLDTADALAPMSSVRAGLN
jgi:hypothetical protein